MKVSESKRGVKFDEGKVRFDLVDGYALYEVARVYTYGTKKYDDNNWRKGMKWGRIFGAMMRHAWAFWRGEEIDEESGLPHMAMAAWQCMTLLNYTKTHPELDDRVKDSDGIKVVKNDKDIKECQHKFIPGVGVCEICGFSYEQKKGVSHG